ncbi:MAG TPA: PAS domain S-box protein, partial [Hyphomicrobiaceae bacterium]|nr:PAS domain S-box protein [Hyphomicrobiaceae bacterium]
MGNTVSLFRAVANSVDAAIVAMTPDGVITHWNNAAERMLGYSAAEIIGEHGRQILPKAWWGYWQDRVAELRRGTTVVCESVRRHKDGSAVDVHATSSGFFSDSGEFLGYFNVFRDLRKKNDQDLTNAFLAAIVRSSPDAILSTNIDLRIRSWNGAAAALFGHPSQDAIGQPLQQFLPVVVADIQSDSGVEKRANVVKRFEVKLTTRTGQERIVSGVASPLLNGAGVPTGWSVSCADVTEQRRLEEHNRFVMRELSHRAKNLLAIIASMARSSADSQRSFADFEAEFSARLKGLAKSHDLLVGEEWRGASLHQLIRDQLRSFVGSSGQSRISITGPDVMLCPAATQCLGLALHELGTNAVKYGALAAPAGSVSITIDADDEERTISWSESGGKPVIAPTVSGFGSVVIQDMVSETLGTDAVIEYRPEGV